MPVAVVPAPQGQPVVATVNAGALEQQGRTPDFPRLLPVAASAWALAQAVADQGQRLELPDGRVLFWWARGSGDGQRVHVLELSRSPLAWAVQALLTLARDEAVQRYPALASLL